MTQPVADAARRYRAAQSGVEAARERVAHAQVSVRETRAELYAAIVAAAVRGERQVDIALAAGLTREQVRRICRAAGIE